MRAKNKELTRQKQLAQKALEYDPQKPWGRESQRAHQAEESGIGLPTDGQTEGNPRMNPRMFFVRIAMQSQEPFSR